jgi:DNA-binding response OmpR family regulator
VASTLLAVDDSLTMRKVLEITFASPDFNIVTANSPDAALQKLKTDKPDLIITDGTLEPKNGYELCKEIKRLFPTTPVLLLSSKQNPFDVAKGTASQVDDHMDKPFDTQQMIDKVKKLLAGQPAGAAKVPTAAQTTPSMPSPLVDPKPSATAKSTVSVAATPQPAAATPMQRAKTLIYNPPAPVGAPLPAAAAPLPTPAAPLPTPTAPAPTPAARPITAVSPAMPRPSPALTATLPGAGIAVAAEEPKAPAHAASAASAQVNGHLSGKLEGLGLTPAQVEAVTALSREIVERVVWEIVPVLAETIIKEELSRLTK